MEKKNFSEKRLFKIFCICHDGMTGVLKTAQADAAVLTSVPMALISVCLRCCQATSARLPRLPAHSLRRYQLIGILEKYKETEISVGFIEGSLAKQPSACTSRRPGLGSEHSSGVRERRLASIPR